MNNGHYIQNDGQSGIARIAVYIESLSTDGILPPRIQLVISTEERNDNSNSQYNSNSPYSYWFQVTHDEYLALGVMCRSRFVQCDFLVACDISRVETRNYWQR
jgi:hypothetical protein